MIQEGEKMEFIKSNKSRMTDIECFDVFKCDHSMSCSFQIPARQYFVHVIISPCRPRCGRLGIDNRLPVR